MIRFARLVTSVCLLHHLLHVVSLSQWDSRKLFSPNPGMNLTAYIRPLNFSYYRICGVLGDIKQSLKTSKEPGANHVRYFP